MTDHQRRMVSIYLGSVVLHASEAELHHVELRSHKQGVRVLPRTIWILKARLLLLRHRAYLKAKRNLMTYLDTIVIDKEKDYAHAA